MTESLIHSPDRTAGVIRDVNLKYLRYNSHVIKSAARATQSCSYADINSPRQVKRTFRRLLSCLFSPTRLSNNSWEQHDYKEDQLAL